MAFRGLYHCAKFGWNRCSSFDNMHVLRFRKFGLKMLIHAPKLAVFRGKIGEGVGRYWPPTNSFLLLGFTRMCPIWWKSTKKCDRESVHRRTHTHTHTRTDAKRFYYLSHAICYSYGADNKQIGVGDSKYVCVLDPVGLLTVHVIWRMRRHRVGL